MKYEELDYLYVCTCLCKLKIIENKLFAKTDAMKQLAQLKYIKKIFTHFYRNDLNYQIININWVLAVSALNFGKWSNPISF